MIDAPRPAPVRRGGGPLATWLHRAAPLAAAVLLGGLACGEDATGPPPPPPPPPPVATTLAVTPASVQLSSLGETAQLSAEVRDQNGRAMPGAAVTWTSADPSVASVDASGLVTAVGNGTATVTAASGSASGAASVSVEQAVASVSVVPDSVELLVGDTVRLSAVAADALGGEVAGAAFAWSSTDTLVATIDSVGLARGVGSGEAEIAASSSGVTGRARLKVADLAATTITVAPDSVALAALGDTVRLAAEVFDQAGRPLPGAAVAWTSADTLVATVDSAGLVTAVGNGTATVTAAADSASGTAAVSVEQTVASVSVEPDSAALLVGDTVRLSATAFDALGGEVAGAAFAWTSADTLVAVVDSAGLVTAVGKGSATITATSGNASGTAAVTVRPPAPSVVVSPAAATIGPGDTLRLVAEAFDESGQRVDDLSFTWSSSDGSVATVDASGLVRGVAEGTATITASADDASGTSEITVAADPDRAALVAFFNATDGPNWVNSENWLTDAPLDYWYGVETDDTGRVVVLSLAGNLDNWPDVTPHGLEGPIPPEIGSLGHLERLVLDNNALTGPIPAEIGNLGNLKRLYLNSNGLTGPVPVQLGGLASLERLYLDNNDLTGPIPTELGNLGNLKRLYLNSNGLTGSIPTQLGGLADLERLYLDSNGLTGPIPAELGNLGNLKRLYLYSNHLTGPIPTELGSLANLERLNLRSNGLTGPIPPGIGSLGSLVDLDLRDNRLSDAIPSSFLLRALDSFHIRGNESLCVPGISAFATWLEEIEHRDSEAISCNADDVAALTQLYEAAGGSGWENSDGWLGDFALDAWFGVSADSLGRVTALDLSYNGLTGRLPGYFGDLARLTELRITGNSDLSGRLPHSIARLSLRVLHYSGTDVCAPVETSFRDWLSTIPSHEGTSAECARHYPINVTWHVCGWTPGPERCLTLREVDPDTVSGLPGNMVSGLRDGIAQWAQVLAPTPAPAPYVVPSDGTPRRWRYPSCAAWHDRGEWAPGDTIRAGLELHVIFEFDADPGDDREPRPGSGPRCFQDTWLHDGTLVPAVTGFINVSPEHYLRRSRHSHAGWRQFAMHEFGHVVGWNWMDTIQPTPVGGGWVVTRDAIVSAFDRLGGGPYPGRKVPLSEGHQSHWHPCVAYNDVMSGSGGKLANDLKVITDLTLSSLALGFKAEPQGIPLPTDAWHTCPELREP